MTLWTGSILALLIAAAFVVSAWWSPIVECSTLPSLGFSEGMVAIAYYRVHDGIFRSFGNPGFSLSCWNVWKVSITPGYVLVPLYAVFAVVAVPTLLAWRFVPKPVKPGHCRCGYDLTGNTSGVCPECGVEVQA